METGIDCCVVCGQETEGVWFLTVVASGMEINFFVCQSCISKAMRMFDKDK